MVVCALSMQSFSKVSRDTRRAQAEAALEQRKKRAPQCDCGALFCVNSALVRGEMLTSP